MHFLTDPLAQLAITHFDNIDINQGDWFFSTFGPGNLTNATDRPHERFSDYETLLNLLRDRNQQKYNELHKGTPFFFLSWLSFDLRNYEKALYYLDAAISEDVKNAGPYWVNKPGAEFLKLTTQQHVAGRIIAQVRGLLIEQIERFNNVSGLGNITIDNFIDNFVANLIHDPSARTIVSALYIFILEKNERMMELKIKSTEGSSLGPIIAHLFSGGIIFESLLKKLYPTKNDGSPIKTLGNIFHTTSFTADFATGIQTSAETLQDILDAINDNTLVTSFTATARIRNTTGHNLVWDNIFNDTTKFEMLYNQIINALFYIVERKYI